MIGELLETSLFWTGATIITFASAQWLWRASGSLQLLHPVLLAIALLALLLTATGTSYTAYFSQAAAIHLLLGPATVALAIPLYSQRKLVLQATPVLVTTLVIGSTFAILAAYLLSFLFGLPEEVSLSSMPKGATTPIAIEVSTQIGGIPALTAVLTVLTGICGAVLGPAVLRLFKVKAEAHKGFAMGLASHGLGTARALEISEEAGAFSGLGMALNGIATAVITPLVVVLLEKILDC